MPVVLALDVATVTGYAHDGPDAGRPIARSWRAPKPRATKGNGTDFGPTFSGYRRWLVETVGVVNPGLVAYEAPLNNVARGGESSIVTNQNTVRILFGLATVTEEVCFTLGVNCCEVNVQTVKAHFGASGLKRDAAKKAIQDRCRLLGWSFTDDNAADAAALWSLAKATTEPQWAPASTPLFGRRRA